MALRFRFRAARPQVAAAAGVMGIGLLVSSLVGAVGSGSMLTAALGAVVLVLATAYFLSPVWRTEVVVDDDGLAVLTGGNPRFRLAWSEVVQVVAGPPPGATAFVDGGAPERSLLLPGRGARAPYRIGNQRELYDQIRAHVDRDRIVEVERIDRAAGRLPETGLPETGRLPETGLPETGLPETGRLPETGLPETGLPETGLPETGRLPENDETAGSPKGPASGPGAGRAP